VWFPPLDSLAGLQMLHRYGAYLVLATMMIAAAQARSAPDPGVRAGAAMAFGLTLTQLVLGVCNVLLGTPPWVSALHLATAAALLAMLVVTTYRVAALPARAARWTAVTVP
jgi:heme A synthase